jgi:hypothetical protein
LQLNLQQLQEDEESDSAEIIMSNSSALHPEDATYYANEAIWNVGVG